MKSLPAVLRPALEAFRQGLSRHFGARLIVIRLFGSFARGDAHEDSDVDVFVVLDRADRADRCAILDLAADLSVEHSILLSPTILDKPTYEKWRRQERMLVMDAEREGIPL